MNEKRLWTDQEDRILKKLVEDTKFTKWTHIARTICDEYGIKGRNGKQCKER
jgi:myb proto-oncogene protein